MKEEPATEQDAARNALPAGEYAIVEVMGHVRHIGRYREVEKFGAKFCEVEPIEDHQFLAPVLVGGASIYQFRPVTAEQAFDMAPQSWDYRRRNDPPAALPAPSTEDEDDGIPFDRRGYDQDDQVD